MLFATLESSGDLCRMVSRPEMRREAISAQNTAGAVSATHYDARNTLVRVAVFLQVLGDGNEDAGRQSHVKNSVPLLSPLFKFLNVLSKGDE